MIGLAVGDALGGRFEAQSAAAIRQRFPSNAHLISYPQDELWYTDDTQMAIGVAEALVARGEIVEDELCAKFVANYVPSRGYGRGARVVLDAMESGEDYRRVAEEYFPGGSYGNGAAMRVAPVGLFFRNDVTRLREQARLSALPTHRHPLGIEAAQILALAIAIVIRTERFDRSAFFAELLTACTSNEFRHKVELASRVRSPADLDALGNGIEAIQSVPTAIASFALTPDSFDDSISHCIFLGGDTDTIAAMSGAVSGAYVGFGRVNPRLVGLLERSPKGGGYIRQLAGSLYDVSTRG